MFQLFNVSAMMNHKILRHENVAETFLIPTACRLRLSFHQSVVEHDDSSILAWNELKIYSWRWRYFGAIFENKPRDKKQ